jgi:Tol biopolymer transport system component
LAKSSLWIRRSVRLIFSLLVLALVSGMSTFRVSTEQAVDLEKCLYVVGNTFPPNGASRIEHSGLLDVRDGTFSAMELPTKPLPKQRARTIPTLARPNYESYIEVDRQPYLQTVELINSGERVELPLPSISIGSAIYWSPDGTLLAYPAYMQDIAEYVVVIANADGRNSQIIVLGGPFAPAGFFGWSPDSEYIAVELDQAEGHRLTFISRADRRQRSLSIHSISLGQPIAWQPLGHQFAYTWEATHLSLIDPTSGEEINFSVAGRQIVELVWSPNGRYIVAGIISNDILGGRYRLDLYGSDGAEIAGVGIMEYNLGSPAWTPDGNSLLFRQPDQNTLLAYHVMDRTYAVFASGVVGFMSATPDNQGVIVEQRHNGKVALNLLRLSSQDTIPLVENLDRVTSLYWFADKSVLIATTKQDGVYNVDIVEIDTLMHHRLLGGLSQTPWFDWPAADDNPHQIAFWWQTASGERGLDSYEASGKRIFRLLVTATELNPMITGATVIWSPDNRLAALVLSEGPAQSSLQIASADGKSLVVTRRKPGIDPSVVWSPDSSKLAFIQVGDAANKTLEVITANGTPILTYAQFADYKLIEWTRCQSVI